MYNYIKIFKPCRRTIAIHDYNYKINDNYIWQINLPFPYMGFINFGSSLCTFVCKEEPTSDDCKIYHPGLGNIYSNGLVCLGDHRPFGGSLIKLIDHFWSSGFELFDNGSGDGLKYARRSLRNWSKLSLDNQRRWPKFETIETIRDIKNLY